MKTISNASPAFVSGAQESARLQIEANGKAFKELISGIYSDKAYAIARELIANAWDAHVLAGNSDRPFDLHLPTVFDPTFSIRDYGTSMDHGTVMTLYRTLFRSTKDDPNSEDSNRFVGKFGLGSKSPFAYTDAFQLTTYLDGTQRVYDIYFNAGAPMISLFLEAETEEENGVLITFPVESKDVDDFARAAKRAMEPLTIQPNMTGRKVELPERRVLFAGTGWKLLDGTFSDAAEALQGTVLYPLRFASIPNCPAHFKPLIEAPLRIEFEIGQLDVTTSRENLSYDDQTTANILARLDEIVDEIKLNVEKRLSAHETYFGWSREYFKLKGAFPSKVWSVIENNPPKFKGRYAPTLNINVRLGFAKEQILSKDKDDRDVITTKFHRRFGNLEFCVISNDSNNYTRSIYDSFYGFKAATSNMRISTRKDIVLVTQDKGIRVTYAHERMKEIVKKYGRDLTYIWVKHTDTDNYAFTRMKGYLGRPEWHAKVNISDIPVPEQVKVENTRDLYKVWRNGGWNSPTGELENEDVYYIVTRRGEPDSKEFRSVGSNTMRALFESLKLSKVISEDAKLISIPISAKSNFFKVYEAEDFEPLLKKYVKTLWNVEEAALRQVSFSENFRYKNRKSIRCFSPPRIYEKFHTIAKEVSLSLRYFGKPKKSDYYMRQETETVEFENLIAGTCIEDAYILWLMWNDADKRHPSLPEEVVLSVVFAGDKKAIAAEIKKVEKRRKELQHQFNVAGGKVHEEFPILAVFENYNLNNLTKKMVARQLKAQIGA